jgi:predicted metal-dependent peptidase
MKQITLIDVRTKKELDKMFNEIDLQWQKQLRRVRKILNNGF